MNPFQAFKKGQEKQNDIRSQLLVKYAQEMEVFTGEIVEMLKSKHWPVSMTTEFAQLLARKIEQSTQETPKGKETIEKIKALSESYFDELYATGKDD